MPDSDRTDSSLKILDENDLNVKEKKEVLYLGGGRDTLASNRKNLTSASFHRKPTRPADLPALSNCLCSVTSVAMRVGGKKKHYTGVSSVSGLKTRCNSEAAV